MAVAEQELLDGRRAFPVAQQLFAGALLRQVSGFVSVGWHDTETHPEAGSFAVVKLRGAYDDELIGEVLEVRAGHRSVFVYVVGAADVDFELSLSRRAFLALGVLANDSLDCLVGVVA